MFVARHCDWANAVFFLAAQFQAKRVSCRLAVEFNSLIVAVFKINFVEYTLRISSLSATQFTVEKSVFERLATTDSNCFCRAPSNFKRDFTAEKQFWRTSLVNYIKLTLSIRSDEGLTLETSAFESLYGG